MYQLCQARIEIENTNGMASTYCMRERNHKGKHSVLSELALSLIKTPEVETAAEQIITERANGQNNK